MATNKKTKPAPQKIEPQEKPEQLDPEEARRILAMESNVRVREFKREFNALMEKYRCVVYPQVTFMENDVMVNLLIIPK